MSQRATAVTALLASALAMTPEARADEPAGVGLFRSFPGLEFGVHLAIAHPGGPVGAGSVATTPRVSDVAPAWLPVGLDAGARLSPRVFVGATVEWGPTLEQQRGACFSCDDGSAFQARGEVRLYGVSWSAFHPWLSVGAGWEALHVAFGQGSASASATYDGPVLLDFKVGVDVRRGALAVGPYLGLSLAEYSSRSLDPAPPGETSLVGALALHEWFSFGVRGTYGPGRATP